MKRSWLLLSTLLILLSLAGPGASQEHPERARPERPTTGEQHPASRGPGVLSLLPSDAVSDHTLDARQGKLTYTATAGTLDLYEQSGERTASIFYTAYVLKGGKAVNRPVTFVFNGGPGAASAFLNLGVVGPKRLDFGPDGRDGARALLVDNPDSWIEFTDLVLIDPIGTGWSRAAKPDETAHFWNVRADAQSLAKVIALYLAHNGRTASPIYLMGESYGGFRAAKLARTLQEEQGLFASGIVMISPLLEGAFLFGGDRFALGAALQLPSLAAAELERRHAFTPEALAGAEHFAMSEYLTTLAGPPPQGEQAKAFYGRIAAMTGLPVDVVTNARGFIRSSYIKHAAASEHDVVSSYDASFAAPDPFPDSEARSHPDPILDGFVRAYGSAFVGYARDELGFKTDITYTLLAQEASHRWDWMSDGGVWNLPSASPDLRELLALTPSFRTLIAHGYSDLVIPYASDRYVIDHLPTIGAADRVVLKLYKGGHMFYLDGQSRTAFTQDARTFYRASTE